MPKKLLKSKARSVARLFWYYFEVLFCGHPFSPDLGVPVDWVSCPDMENSPTGPGVGSTLFPDRLFWRQIKFGGNWLHIIFWQIVLEAAQIWRELAPHYFLVDCFGNLEGPDSTLFSSRLFWRQLRFGRNWLHIIFQQIVLEAAQIWRELAPHYFLTDCFGGSSNLAGTDSTLFSGGLFWKFGFTNLSIGDTWEHPYGVYLEMNHCIPILLKINAII